MTDHTPSGLPQPQTVADVELLQRLDTVACCCEQGVSEPYDARWIRMAIDRLTALSAPAVETVAVQEAPGWNAAQLDSMLTDALKERDHCHDMADQLAAQIAAITGEEIGEHSSGNDPWRNAMLAADEFIAVQLRKLLSPLPVAPKAEQAATQAEAKEPESYGEGLDGARLMLLASSPPPDEAVRLMSMLLGAFGSRHPAVDDLMALTLKAAPTAPTQPDTYAKLQSAYVGACDRISELLAEQAAPKAEPRPLFDPEFPNQGYVSDAEWAARKAGSPAELLTEIEGYDFACEAGPLVLCEDWQRLRALLATPPTGVEGADPLQGAADWLVRALHKCDVADLQSSLLIGYNRAKRLFDAAQPVAGHQGGEA